MYVHLTHATKLRYHVYMTTYQDILSEIRKRGHRLTRARTGIVKLLWKKKRPLTAIDIRELLERQDLCVNKTTIYRELGFLTQEKYIEEVWLNDGRKYYEYISEHHHHLICIECRGVDDIVLETEFEKTEKHIQRKEGFKILNHSLEFFGVCAQCQ